MITDGVIESLIVSDIENLVPADERGDEATANESPDTAPGADHCIWPGCTRPRAPGRVTGSGRQKEYCLQADPPERGGSPVHNARNRWAALRAGAGRPVTPGEPSGGNAGGDGGPAGAAGPGAGQGNAGGGQPATSGRDPGPFTSAKKRAGELLEQARRQHAAALDGLRAECELYQRAGEELAALSDPAALDLEIATIAARAGRQVAQAEQDAADAHRADEAAEQLTEDTAEAERVLAERTAGFERDLADLASRAQAAEAAQRAARDEAAAVKAAAEAEVTAARDAAESARARAEETAAEARAAAAAARDQARREVAAAQERADGLIAAARLEADKAVAGVREQAARERALVEQRALAADAGADRARAERDRAQAAAASAAAAGAAAEARATAVTGELERAREEAGRLRDVHAGELARLESAHEALLGAERARAARAEADLDALRAATA
jgi:hypothetical protein